MRGVGSIYRLLAVVLVMALLGGMYIALPKFAEEFNPAPTEADLNLEKLLADRELTGFEPGRHEFNRALDLISVGKMDEARERLMFIRNLHPGSKVGPEAMRILGELNLDRLLSVENMANKRIHRVAPGEGYLSVAMGNGMTLEGLLFLNGLTELSRLHVGDEFIVMPLECRLVVDLVRQTVVLYCREEGVEDFQLVKDYPIERFKVGRLKREPYETKVSRKYATQNGGYFQPGHAKYQHGEKVIGFYVGGKMTLLRGGGGEGSDRGENGIFLKSSDLEELSMLVQKGNEVEVRPGG